MGEKPDQGALRPCSCKRLHAPKQGAYTGKLSPANTPSMLIDCICVIGTGLTWPSDVYKMHATATHHDPGKQIAFDARAGVRCKGEACLIKGKLEAEEVQGIVSVPGHAYLRSPQLHNLWLQAAGEQSKPHGLHIAATAISPTSKTPLDSQSESDVMWACACNVEFKSSQKPPHPLKCKISPLLCCQTI